MKLRVRTPNLAVIVLLLVSLFAVPIVAQKKSRHAGCGPPRRRGSRRLLRKS